MGTLKDIELSIDPITRQCFCLNAIGQMTIACGISGLSVIEPARLLKMAFAVLTALEDKKDNIENGMIRLTAPKVLQLEGKDLVVEEDSEKAEARMWIQPCEHRGHEVTAYPKASPSTYNPPTGERGN